MSILRHRSPAAPERLSANDRLKRSWNRLVWGATSTAVVLHAGVIAFTPRATVEVPEPREFSAAEIVRMVRLAERIIPEPPEFAALSELQMPVFAPMAFEMELAPSYDPLLMLPDFNDFDLSGQALVPPAPPVAEGGFLDYRDFASFVVRPEISNRSELKKFLERSYQPIYEYTGDTGVVQVSFWINEGGVVEKAEIAQSSGSRSLDRLALRLSRILRFRPAMMAGRPVRIMVHVPITFRAA